MHRKFWIFMLVLAFALCSSSLFASPQYGGEFVGFSSSDPRTLDPAVLDSWDQAVMAANVLEGLVRLSPCGTTIEPGVAENWEVSEDGLVWTFTIRDNAKFHDGSKVTAADVQYSFQRIIDPQTRSPQAWLFNKVQGYQEFRSGDANTVEGLQALDEHTLEITLIEPLTPFLSMLASPGASVVQQKAVEYYGDRFGQQVVSAGPFRLARWQENLEIEMEAFEEYWAGRPYLDTLRFRFIHDENTRIVELMAGNLDWAWVTPAYHQALTITSEYKDSINRANTLHTGFFIVNMDKDPFGGDVLLRQAFRYALDVDSVIGSLQGRANKAVSIFPPGFLGHDPEAEAYNFDPEKARALLAEAGYEDGLPGTYSIMTLPWANLIKILEIYQQNLRQAGIDIVIEAVQHGEYMTRLNEGDFDLAWGYRVADYADPDAFTFPLLHSDSIDGGGNAARYVNEEVDSLIEKGRLTTDETEREQIYRDIAALVQADKPYIVATHNIWVDVTSPHVRNFVPSAMDVHIFHRVWLDQ